MKTSSAALHFRRAALARIQVPTVTRSVSSSISHDASDEAESSTAGQGRKLPGESEEDAFKRNLQELQVHRRRKQADRSRSSLLLPPNTPKPKANPLQASLSTLLASGAALGHSTSLLNPSFTPYIYGNRSGLTIIDLDQTLPILRRTAALVRDVVEADGVILIVGTRPGVRKAMEQAKARLGDNGYIVDKWMPGTFTNADSYFGLDPIVNKTLLPDLVIFLNPSENISAIRECTGKQVPTVGIIDTDTDPRIVTYPIPANMESIRTAQLIIGTLSIAGQEGRRIRLLKSQEARELNSAHKS